MKKLIHSAILTAALTSTSAFSFQFDNQPFDEYFDNITKQFFGNSILQNSVIYPVVDIYQNKNEYIINVEVPGMEKKDIEVSISDGNLLTIQGMKKNKYKSENSLVLKEESFFGQFQRTIVLPKDIDTSNVHVTYHNSILTIKIKRISRLENNKKILQIN